MLRTMVAPDSIPPDFDAALGGYVRDGLRVLALAWGDASQVSAPSNCGLDDAVSGKAYRART